jgi:hypothetical protein
VEPNVAPREPGEEVRDDALATGEVDGGQRLPPASPSTGELRSADNVIDV